MKIYLSGQISGTELSYTRKRFGDVADTLRALGHEVTNPLCNGLSETDPMGGTHGERYYRPTPMRGDLYACRVGRKPRGTNRTRPLGRDRGVLRGIQLRIYKTSPSGEVFL